MERIAAGADREAVGIAAAPGETGAMDLAAPLPCAAPLPFPDEFARLGETAREVCVVLYLDRAGRRLGLRHMVSQQPDTMTFPVRALAGDALAFGAAAVILAHCHPSGDPRPSRVDRDATRRLARALDAIDVRLIDHWIIAGSARTSLRALGLI